VRAVVFAYHGIGRIGLDAVVRHGFDVRGLITHPDDPDETIWWESAAARGSDLGIPVVRRAKAQDPGLLEAVAGWRPEVLFSFYYRHLLPEAVLVATPRGGYNLHGSLLPRYRGRAPLNWVLVNGETETGVTLHRMTPRADAGGIVDRERVAIAPLDTAFTLYRKLEGAAERLLARALPLILSGTAAETAQDSALATHFGGRTPEDGRIDWAWPATQVYDLIRAVTHPYPGAFTTWSGRRLFVWWALPLEQAPNAPPGTVLAADGDGIVVAAGIGCLRLVTIQAEGEPELPATVFAAAAGFAPGDRLGGGGEAS
jgi:UDP-4-amino-4-deoxy-L-arabinose formyltransferase/UDP-glucuronic acid dehydrogenase (UDP-4-keto-hexauronic acid decarboxylating)